MSGNGERWAARLKCGHDAGDLQHAPAVGSWITCTSLECQGQRRVMSVRKVVAVRAWVQGELFARRVA